MKGQDVEIADLRHRIDNIDQALQRCGVIKQPATVRLEDEELSNDG